MDMTAARCADQTPDARRHLGHKAGGAEAARVSRKSPHRSHHLANPSPRARSRSTAVRRPLGHVAEAKLSDVLRSTAHQIPFATSAYGAQMAVGPA